MCLNTYILHSRYEFTPCLLYSLMVQDLRCLCLSRRVPQCLILSKHSNTRRFSGILILQSIRDSGRQATPLPNPLPPAYHRTMAAVTSPETSPQPRVYFQTPTSSTEETETPVRKQGRVTVKYDRKELRKRLNLEEWIINQLTDLYDCEVRSERLTLR